MEKVIKTFNGYSGSDVFLIQDNEHVFIRKINNIDRNFKQLQVLYELGFNVPRIYKKTKYILEMEYINGLDIKVYLERYSLDNLLFFIKNLITKLNTVNKTKNYSNVYNQKLNWIDKEKIFPFSANELINFLPKELPQSYYHGDLTLENIIYNNNKFYLIDCLDTEYDSWVFDLAKLRQDLKCKWFIRNDKNCNCANYLNILDQELINIFPIINNNSLLILMLLRVYAYAKNSNDKDFLFKEIINLWTS